MKKKLYSFFLCTLVFLSCTDADPDPDPDKPPGVIVVDETPVEEGIIKFRNLVFDSFSLETVSQFKLDWMDPDYSRMGIYYVDNINGTHSIKFIGGSDAIDPNLLPKYTSGDQFTFIPVNSDFKILITDGTDSLIVIPREKDSGRIDVWHGGRYNSNYAQLANKMILNLSKNKYIFRPTDPLPFSEEEAIKKSSGNQTIKYIEFVIESLDFNGFQPHDVSFRSENGTGATFKFLTADRDFLLEYAGEGDFISSEETAYIGPSFGGYLAKNREFRAIRGNDTIFFKPKDKYSTVVFSHRSKNVYQGVFKNYANKFVENLPNEKFKLID